MEKGSANRSGPDQSNEECRVTHLDHRVRRQAQPRVRDQRASPVPADGDDPAATASGAYFYHKIRRAPHLAVTDTDMQEGLPRPVPN
jgi:hypothetical protein